MLMGWQNPAPAAERRPLVREAHGVTRTDDYAWLRDVDDPRVAAHLAAERAHYDRAVEHLRPFRDLLAEELTARTPLSERSARWRRGGFGYVTQTEPGQGYEQLVRIDPGTGEDRLLLDPSRIAAGSAYLRLGLVEPSPDGRLLAYSVDLTGDEVFELRFRDLATGADLPDRVPRTCGGGAWSADATTFVYAVPDQATRPDRVVRHRIGTPVEDDVPLLAEPDPRFRLSVHASRDGGWIVVTTSSRDTTAVHLVSAADPGEAPRLVAAARPGIEYAVEPMPGGWDGLGADLLLLVTNDGAPEFRLVSAAVPGPGQTGDPASWQVVPRSVAADGSERLESVCVLARHLVLSLRGGCEPFLRVLGRGPGTAVGDRSVREIHPGVPCGQVRLWRAEDPTATIITVVEENLVTAQRWVQVDLHTGDRRVIKRRELPGVDPSRYVTERLTATAPDGTAVPVTIARLRELEPGTGNGAVLYGYGAYETCSWPQFAPSTLSLLDRGVVYAVAHVRGGGELGRRWWQAGRSGAKQNTFTDFLAARDALVGAGWAAPDAVVSRGRSAGGLLQGAVYSQAPDRWRAVVAEVPFVDVVTTMSDPTLPLTPWEWGEWGDPITDPEAFATMLAYSPYDNPPPAVDRPALLVTGRLRDRQVLVHEPVKWVAQLRATDDVGAPSRTLLRLGFDDGGHAGPTGRRPALDDEAEILSWILDQLGVKPGPG